MTTEPMLTSHQLYIRELKQFPALSKEEQRVLQEQVHEGNMQARERLIIECMHFVERQAALYARAYLRYDDYLDLIQVGNLAIVEHIDKVLADGKSVPYVCAIARRVIRWYCLYRSSVIAFPMNKALPSKEEQPTILSMEQLTEDRDETWMQVARLIAGMEQPVASALYGPLQHALETLSPREREVVTRHYGLDGGTAEELIDINKQFAANSNIAQVHYYRALKRLRARLKQA